MHSHICYMCVFVCLFKIYSTAGTPPLSIGIKTYILTPSLCDVLPPVPTPTFITIQYMECKLRVWQGTHWDLYKALPSH